MVSLKADLYDGSYHDVDSSEMSFKLAASIAYKEGMKKASPIILEPVGALNVTVPDALVGDVLSTIMKRRGSLFYAVDMPKKECYSRQNAFFGSGFKKSSRCSGNCSTIGREIVEFGLTVRGVKE